MKSIYLLIFSLLLFTGCTSKYSEEIKEVEELQLRVKSLKNTFDEVDIDRVNMARKAYKENMIQIEKFYQQDTIEIDFGNTLNHYKGIKKAGKNIDQLYLNYTSDLTKMETQLYNLKTDISNNSWEEDSLKNFIKFESEKLETLGDNIGTFVLNCEYIINTHDSLSDKVRGYTSIF